MRRAAGPRSIKPSCPGRLVVGEECRSKLIGKKRLPCVVIAKGKWDSLRRENPARDATTIEESDRRARGYATCGEVQPRGIVDMQLLCLKDKNHARKDIAKVLIVAGDRKSTRLNSSHRL